MQVHTHIRTHTCTQIPGNQTQGADSSGHPSDLPALHLTCPKALITTSWLLLDPLARCSSVCSARSVRLIRKAQCSKVPYWDGCFLEAGRLRGPQLPKAGVDIVCSTQLLKDWNQVQQLCICHVIKPGLHRHLGAGKVMLESDFSFPCQCPGGCWDTWGSTHLW